MEQKKKGKYINGFIIREHTFEDGNTQLNVSVNTKEFLEEIKAITNENGWANVKISKRREASEAGVTHYIQEDTWKPNKDLVKAKPMTLDSKDDDDGLPF